MTEPIDRATPALTSQPLTIEEVLELDDCYNKLASQRIGRVIFTQGALPVVTPARFAVEGADIYFSTGPRLEQRAGIGGAVVAFEVDSLDLDAGTGWAITVTGIAEPCTHPSRWPLVARLGLLPFDRHCDAVFRLPPGIVSGRRFAACETT